MSASSSQRLPLWVDVVEKLVSVETVGPVEKTDVHNRAIFDDLTSRNVATYLEKIRCRVFQHNRSLAVFHQGNQSASDSCRPQPVIATTKIRLKGRTAI
jgi:hypothetical protein